MKLGDLLEILGACCFVIAASVWWGVAAGFAVAGLAFLYEGQCFGAHPLPKIKLPKVPRPEWIDPLNFTAARKRRAEAEAAAVGSEQ